MSDSDSLEPKKPARKRKNSVSEVPDLSGAEQAAKPGRVTRKKTPEARTPEAESVSEAKPRIRKTVAKSGTGEKSPEATISAFPEVVESKPKRVVRKKPVEDSASVMKEAKIESAEKTPGKTVRKKAEPKNGTEPLPLEMPPVPAAEGKAKTSSVPARRKKVEEKNSEEPAVLPAARRGRPRKADSAPSQAEGTPESLKKMQPQPSSTVSAQETPISVRRVTMKRISSASSESKGERRGDEVSVTEHVSGLTEETPVDGLPVRNTRIVRREFVPNQRRDGNGNGNGQNQNREGFNNRRENNNGQGRDFNQNRNDRRNGKFNKQKNKNRPFNNDRNDRNDRPNNNNYNNRREFQQESALVVTGEPYEVNGLLELAPKGFGFLRTPDNDFDQVTGGIYVAPDIIRKNGLRHCQWIHGRAHETNRGVQFCELISVNGLAPDEARKLPHFEDLKAINPNKRYCLETTPERYTTRVVDMMAPIGRGQRGLIVAPPRTGKTVLLQHMAEAIVEKYDEEVHLMILLIDERPEEVTEFKRGIKGAEVYASSNDGRVRDHCRLAELCIERAKRLVEAGRHVFLLMDSITRLARAYNNASTGNGRTMSGGIDARALEMPRRLFAAARNTRGAGSLTIIATALIETNSRMDDLIFQEFKGTGNMELVLNRRIAEQYIYPAVDILKSGTRREELILPDLVLDKVNLIRRALAGHRPVEAMERLLFFLQKYPNNAQMLIDLKQRA